MMHHFEFYRNFIYVLVIHIIKYIHLTKFIFFQLIPYSGSVRHIA